MLVEHMDLGLELSSLSPWVQPLSSYYAEYVWHVNDCPLARSTKWLSKKMNSNHQKKARAIFVMEPGFGLRCVSLQRLAPTMPCCLVECVLGCKFGNCNKSWNERGKAS